MTRIDFYLLSGADKSERYNLVCRLTEKACAAGNRVFIHSQCDDELGTLDEQLWTFKSLSFVAHAYVNPQIMTADSMDSPVLLSTGEPDHGAGLLINLAPRVPAFFSRFKRTLEVVDEDPVVQCSGRERYRFYKERGYPLHHHRM